MGSTAEAARRAVPSSHQQLEWESKAGRFGVKVSVENEPNSVTVQKMDLRLTGIKAHVSELLHSLLLTGTQPPCGLPILRSGLLGPLLAVLLGPLSLGPSAPIGTIWAVALTARDCLVPTT